MKSGHKPGPQRETFHSRIRGNQNVSIQRQRHGDFSPLQEGCPQNPRGQIMLKHTLFLFLLGMTLFSLLIVGCGGSKIDPDYRIVVNWGHFDSVQKAATGEAAIDWNGSDTLQMNACTESFAAAELQSYLRKIFQKPEKFPIVSLQQKWPPKALVIADLSQQKINKTLDSIIRRNGLDKKLLANESFALIPDAKRLFIIGHDRVGTMYGVFQLLENLGVRWYSPEKTGTVLSNSGQFSLSKQKATQKPDFFTRGFWAWEDRGYPEFYLWMAHNRLNFWTIAEPNHAFLHKLGIQLTVGGHLHFHKFLNPDDEYPYNHPLFKGDENKPRDPYRVNLKEFRGDVNQDGKLSYFEAHPEWYGLINGKRQKFKGDFGTNICTSNADAVAEFSRKFVNELADGEWKDASSVNLWPLDGGKWCTCENCQKLGTPTDRLLLFIYDVNKSLRKAIQSGRIHHDVKLIFPIYNETLSPPTRPLPADFDYQHCIGTFFPIRRCYVHFIDDSTCTEFNAPIWKDFLGWAVANPRYYKGQFFIGEYYNVSKINCLPVIYTRIMSHDIPTYFRYGARHFHYMHVYTRLLGMKRWNNYLFARLLWNTRANVKRLQSDYFANVYGPAASQMARLYERLEYGMSSVKQWKHSQPLTSQIYGDKKPLFNLEHLKLREYHPPKNDGVDLEESVQALAECRRILNRVEQMNLSPVIQKRLTEDDHNLHYAENTVNFYYYFAQAILAKRAGNPAEQRKFFLKSIPFAKQLEAETEILKTAASHAYRKNALLATRVNDPYQKMAKELGILFE